MNEAHSCGFSFWRPKALQKYATSRNFMIFYGILGTFQNMTIQYATVTLTTLEKRFQIPSYVTGFVFSGNEVSQILLSLVLAYLGGQHNRPRWIAWGGAMSAVACLVMGGSHLYFGPGDDAIQLTEEYLHRNDLARSAILNYSLTDTSTVNFDPKHNICYSEPSDECSSDTERITVLPLILIFATRFVLGIGLSLYITLGTPYLDDGVKRTNTPYMLAFAMTFKMLGNLSFIIVNISLRMYVDPWSTPIITQDDPRWIGAWWFGYIVLGIGMALVSVFIGIFPEQLPGRAPLRTNINEDSKPMGFTTDETKALRNESKPNKVMNEDFAMDDFFVSLKRLLTNKLVMFKLTSEVFYVLAGIGITVYYSKYMEVLFNRSPSDASIVTAPFEMVTTIGAFFVAAVIVGKCQPSFRWLTFSSIVVGIMYAVGFAVWMFQTCDSTSIASQLLDSINDGTTGCNLINCSCGTVPFSPVCDVGAKVTFFSPCHAGCTSWNDTALTFDGCSCADPDYRYGTNESSNYALSLGACIQHCVTAFLTYVIMITTFSAIGSGVNIGKGLMDMRVVADKDKSFSSGLTVWTLSICAMIPGRILYGYVIDSTCIIWNDKCGQRGNCELYDQDLFRYYINGMAMAFSAIGFCFEILTWYFGKNIKLYDEPNLNKVDF